MTIKKRRWDCDYDGCTRGAHGAAQTVHASWAPHVQCGHQTYGPDRDGQVDGHCCACEGEPCREQQQMQRAADRRLLADVRGATG